MKTRHLEIHPDDYGHEYAGQYQVIALSWKFARELLRKAVRNKDEAAYVEDLILASVLTPKAVAIKKEELGDYPAGLVRRLMDLTLELNDVSKVETAFLSSSATPAVQASPMETSTSKN